MLIDKTAQFTALRSKKSNKASIITTKLENRLSKILIGLQKFSTSNAWPWTLSNEIVEFERSIVPWENEQVFERCRFCGQKFNILLRKHHCRVCGLVVCGDLERECSLEVPANLLASKLVECGFNQDFKNITTDLPLRLCTECRRAVFSIRNYKLDVKSTLPPLLVLHKQLKRIQQEIDFKMPRFEDSVLKISENNANLSEVRKNRHELLSLFTKYEKIVRRIRQMGMDDDISITFKTIQNNMVAQAMLYLEYAMIPLQALPESMRYRETVKTKRETEKFQNTVLVLEEQKFLLEKQLENARRDRDLESVIPLESSIKELDLEINKLSA